MKVFATALVGAEDIAALEVKELIGAVSETRPGHIFFDATPQELADLIYRTQSLLRVCMFLEEFSVSGLDSIPIPQLDVPGSVAVVCDRFGEHDFTSHDVVLQLHKSITSAPMSFKGELVLYVSIRESVGCMGVDLSGDLAKREYRMFGHAHDMAAPLAYTLLRLAQFSHKTSLIDPLARAGTVPIEAALFASQKSPRHYQESFPFQKFGFPKWHMPRFRNHAPIICASPSMAFLKSAEKNAKLAGVHASLSFSRMDVENLDLKFEGVNLLVSYPPQKSKAANSAKVDRLYKELAKQLSLIGAKACFLSDHSCEGAREVLVGKRRYYITGKL